MNFLVWSSLTKKNKRETLSNGAWGLWKAMLLRLFKNVDGCVSDPPKIVYFWRIWHGCGNIFGESKQLRWKDQTTYASGSSCFLICCFSAFMYANVVIFKVRLSLEAWYKTCWALCLALCTLQCRHQGMLFLASESEFSPEDATQ